MRPRGEYYFRAILCFIMGPTILVGTIVLQGQLDISTLQAILTGMGLFILFMVIGLLNYGLYKNDKNREDRQAERIKQLEEENRNLKNKTNDRY